MATLHLKASNAMLPDGIGKSVPLAIRRLLSRLFIISQTAEPQCEATHTFKKNVRKPHSSSGRRRHLLNGLYGKVFRPGCSTRSRL